MTTKIKNNLILIMIVILNFAVDQISKLIALANLSDGPRINIIGTLFQLDYEYNDGAFLGMGGDWPFPIKLTILIILPVVAMVFASIYILKGKAHTFRQAVAIAVIIGGGLGNIYDRIFNNLEVFDFLHFGIGPHFRTGVLNVADLSVTFGAIILIIFSYLDEKNDRKLKENN